MSRH